MLLPHLAYQFQPFTWTLRHLNRANSIVNINKTSPFWSWHLHNGCICGRQGAYFTHNEGGGEGIVGLKWVIGRSPWLTAPTGALPRPSRSDPRLMAGLHPGQRRAANHAANISAFWTVLVELGSKNLDDGQGRVFRTFAKQLRFSTSKGRRPLYICLDRFRCKKSYPAQWKKKNPKIWNLHVLPAEGFHSEVQSVRSLGQNL